MSGDRLQTPPEASSARKLKQQSILKSASPLKNQKLTGLEVKATHQWKVVIYIISASLPFVTVEGPWFRSLLWASDYCSQMDRRTVKHMIKSKYKEMLTDRTADEGSSSISDIGPLD
jgi:hypothetical protein